MPTYDELPDVQREVLRQVFFAPDHVASPDHIKAHCYYPDVEVEQAIRDLVETFDLVVVKPNPDPHYVPSTPLLREMQAKRDQADAGLRSALNQAKPFLRDGDES